MHDGIDGVRFALINTRWMNVQMFSTLKYHHWAKAYLNYFCFSPTWSKTRMSLCWDNHIWSAYPMVQANQPASLSASSKASKHEPKSATVDSKHLKSSTIIIKLGGGLITDKRKQCTARLDVIRKLALSLKTVVRVCWRSRRPACVWKLASSCQ